MFEPGFAGRLEFHLAPLGAHMRGSKTVGEDLQSNRGSSLVKTDLSHVARAKSKLPLEYGNGNV